MVRPTPTPSIPLDTPQPTKRRDRAPPADIRTQPTRLHATDAARGRSRAGVHQDVGALAARVRFVRGARGLPVRSASGVDEGGIEAERVRDGVW
jgi:hypothetical protein